MRKRKPWKLGKTVPTSPPEIPPSLKSALVVGFSAAVGEWILRRYFGTSLGTVVQAVLQTPVKRHHPEGAEPITTAIDERQLGRSEVVRAVARGSRN